MIFLCFPAKSHSLTTISEIIKPDSYSGGVPEVYLNDKIKEIVLNYINSQAWDIKTKGLYSDNYSRIVAGYTLKKLDDTEGAYLLKISLNFNSAPPAVRLNSVTVISHDTKFFDNVKMVNAVLEDILGKNLYPVYVSRDESRWDLETPLTAEYVFHKTSEYFRTYNVINDGNKVIIRPNTP